VQLQRRYVGYPVQSRRRHGPAVTTDPLGIPTTPFVGRVAGSQSTADLVPCMRCLLWPPQAADWPTRHRNYDRPDSATVDRVVSNGCDMVQVAHRLCRQDEWMNQHQCRLSFSRAEIIVLRTVHQTVYHMLRYFVKSQGLTGMTDNTGAKILSNYILKTLMPWACELKPISWWIDNFNFIRVVVELLHTLAVWLTDGRCQHYFINNCNLMDFINDSNSACVQQIVLQLSPITETWLAEWFINNYIHRCVHLCPDNVLCTDLQERVSGIIRARFITSSIATVANFRAAKIVVIARVSTSSLTVRQCLFWMTELAKFDRDLSVYFTAVAFLHVADKTARKSLEDRLLDVLATACLQSNDLRRCRCARHSSVLSFKPWLQLK